MKIKDKTLVLFLSLLAVVSLTTLAPEIAYASSTGTSNAVQDIMNHDRFQGAVDTIEFITTRIDFWFTAIISAVSFFIISAALLKNACAGAYVANQKFWNNVSDAHEAMDASKLAGVFQKGGMQNFMSSLGSGGIKNFLLCLVPNIKALTDFDDTDLEPKAYFVKAIPQMLACIIIGVFIYNGYYRDTASTVGSFGSEICNRLFASVDPVTFVDKITQTTSVPESIYANDPSLQGKAIYKISQEIYKTFLSESKNLTDMESKTSLMRDSEKKAYDLTNETKMKDLFFSDGRKYDFSVSNIQVTAVPDSSTYSKLNANASVELIDTKTQSKYSVKKYTNAPNTSTQYVPKSKAYCYIGLVMTGSQRSDAEGETNILAESGSWGGDTTATVNATLHLDGDHVVKRGSDKVGKGTVSCEKIVSGCNDDIKKNIQKTMKEVAKEGSLEYRIVSYNNTTGQRGTMLISGVPLIKGEPELRFNVRYKVMYDAKDGNSSSKQSRYITVPIACDLKE